MLVIDSDQILVEPFAGDGIPPQLVQLSFDRSGQSTPESLFQNVDISLDLFFCRGFKKDPEFPKGIKLTVSEIKGMLALSLPVFHFLGKNPFNGHDRLVVPARQVGGLFIGSAFDCTDHPRNIAGNDSTFIVEKEKLLKTAGLAENEQALLQ